MKQKTKEKIAEVVVSFLVFAVISVSLTIVILVHEYYRLPSVVLTVLFILVFGGALFLLKLFLWKKNKGNIEV